MAYAQRHTRSRSPHRVSPRVVLAFDCQGGWCDCLWREEVLGERTRRREGAEGKHHLPATCLVNVSSNPVALLTWTAHCDGHWHCLRPGATSTSTLCLSRGCICRDLAHLTSSMGPWQAVFLSVGLSRRVSSVRIASHLIASHRIASHHPLALASTTAQELSPLPTLLTSEETRVRA